MTVRFNTQFIQMINSYNSKSGYIFPQLERSVFTFLAPSIHNENLKVCACFRIISLVESSSSEDSFLKEKKINIYAPLMKFNSPPSSH